MAGSVAGWLAEIIAFLGLFAILRSAVIFHEGTVFPGAHALHPVLGAAALIWAGGHHATWMTRLLRLSPLTFIGKISYSLYLWHWPIVAYLNYATDNRPGPLASWAGIVASVLCAILSWRFVERPFRGPPAGRSALLAFAAAAMATLVAGAVGTVTFLYDGFPARMRSVAYGPEIGHELVVHKHIDFTCVEFASERVINDDLCQLGSADMPPTFLLLGDSHANAVAPAISYTAALHHLSGIQLTAPGFLPSLEPQNNPLNGELSAVFDDFMDRHPELKKVIITNFWTTRVTGTDYARHPAPDWVPLGPLARQGAISERVFRDLARIAERYPDRQIILLDDVAIGSGLDPSAFLRRAWLGSGEDPAKAGVAMIVEKAQRNQYEPTLRRVAKTHPNVRYIPIFAEMCDDGLCPLFRGSVVMYRDRDHISSAGALSILQQVQQKLFSQF